ncbi:hypothetical protein TNCV_2411471 [Trichonephila clavipes]|nr:hypothetical protein TNCV_2411471 [Trichonephila clavipes]
MIPTPRRYPLRRIHVAPGVTKMIGGRKFSLVEDVRASRTASEHVDPFCRYLAVCDSRLIQVEQVLSGLKHHYATMWHHIWNVIAYGSKVPPVHMQGTETAQRSADHVVQS